MRSLWASVRCCVNPRVVAGLAGTVAVLSLVSATATAAALPVLVVMVCPLSMGLAAWGMRRRNDATPADGDVDAELSRLRAEVAALRAEREPTAGTMRPDHSLVGLRR